MELNIHTLVKLIKEEISLYEFADKPTPEEAAQSLATTLAGYAGAGMNIDSIFADAKRIMTNPADADPGNRLDISEMGCQDQEVSISQGVDDKEDHEGSMAKRQMFKTAEYATIIFDMLGDDEELPAWIQSKLTKVADYIGAVKHYLEYDKVMDMQPANRKEKKWSDADHDKQEKIAQGLAKDNPDMPKDEKMAIAGAQVNRDKRKK
jgi:hypothetical protein